MTSIIERPVITGRRAPVAEQAVPHAPVTTTHDPAGGGRPRLVLPAGQGWGRVIHDLAPVSSVGSGEEALIRLPGLHAVQAEVRRDEEDEYRLHVLAGALDVRVDGALVRPGSPGVLLRTGTRVQVGLWVLTYCRDEHADHGRPYGGRIGGELGRQRSQARVRFLSGAGDAV